MICDLCQFPKNAAVRDTNLLLKFKASAWPTRSLVKGGEVRKHNRAWQQVSVKATFRAAT